MLRINKHIEIVRSSIPRLSSLSRVSCDALFKVLRKNYTHVGVSTVNNLVGLESLTARNPDLVFLGMNYVPHSLPEDVTGSDKIWISDYLDERSIACTGSDRQAHIYEVSKPLAKQRVADAGLKTASFVVASTDVPLTDATFPLPFPVFIKPTDRGGGLGIDSTSLAHNFTELNNKIQRIRQNFHSDALIETYLSGREFSVAILKSEDADSYYSMPIELVAPQDEKGTRMLSNKVKSSDSEQAIPVTDTFIYKQITKLAVSVFTALGARDYGRIDIRMDEFGVPHFLEANLIPSLIANYGSFPKACVMNLGLDYEPMILSIVNLGLARQLPVKSQFVLAPSAV